MESSTVQPGSLGGINPSEDVEAELASLSGQDADGPVGVTGKPSAAGEPATPVEEREEPETPAQKKGSASRLYVVLKQDNFDAGGEFFEVVHEVEARNATNALRKAARELQSQLGDGALLLVVPKTMWRPTPVSLTVSERVSVSIG